MVNINPSPIFPLKETIILHNLNGQLEHVKAIIFDFDGVILESGNIKTEAFLELFADYPQHQQAILNHHLENLSVSRYDKFAWVYQELLRQVYTPTEQERMGSAFSAIVLDKVLNCPFVPGALETLEALQGWYPMFVASGTPQEELELIVKKRGLAKRFVEVWGTPLKKVEIIHDILNRYDLSREEVLFIGDGVSDYQAATETGLLFIARDTPEQHQQWLDLQVPRVPDLSRLVSAFYPALSTQITG